MGFLAGALVLTASGQIAFKLGTTTKNRLVVACGLAALVAAMVCSLFALRTLGIGFAYLSTGLTHVLILFGSRFILHEDVPRERWMGAAIIVAGVSLYGVSV